MDWSIHYFFINEAIFLFILALELTVAAIASIVVIMLFYEDGVQGFIFEILCGFLFYSFVQIHSFLCIC